MGVSEKWSLRYIVGPRSIQMNTCGGFFVPCGGAEKLENRKTEKPRGVSRARRPEVVDYVVINHRTTYSTTFGFYYSVVHIESLSRAPPSLLISPLRTVSIIMLRYPVILFNEDRRADQATSLHRSKFPKKYSPVWIDL